jgi:hypothetical protein
MSNNGIERTAVISKNLAAIIALISIIVGGLSGFLSSFLFLNNEMEIWRQIKAAHDAPIPNSDAVVYNHSKLGVEDIDAIKARINLPDFGLFSMKSEVPVASFVKYGDYFYIVSENGLNWKLQAGGAGGLTAGPLTPTHADRNEWILEKSR